MLVWVSLAIGTLALLMLWVAIGLLKLALEDVGHGVSDILDREP